MNQPANFIFLRDTASIGVWVNLSLVETVWERKEENETFLTCSVGLTGASISFGGEEAKKLIEALEQLSSKGKYK